MLNNSRSISRQSRPVVRVASWLQTRALTSAQTHGSSTRCIGCSSRPPTNSPRVGGSSSLDTGRVRERRRRQLTRRQHSLLRNQLQSTVRPPSPEAPQRRPGRQHPLLRTALQQRLRLHLPHRLRHPRRQHQQPQSLPLQRRRRCQRAVNHCVASLQRLSKTWRPASMFRQPRASATSRLAYSRSIARSSTDI